MIELSKITVLFFILKLVVGRPNELFQSEVNKSLKAFKLLLDIT